MTPAHLHKAIHGYLGLDSFATALGLDFSNQESVPIFDRFQPRNFHKENWPSLRARALLALRRL